MGATSSRTAIQHQISKYQIRSKDQSKGLLYLTQKSSSKHFAYRQLHLGDDLNTKAFNRLLQKKKALHHENIVCMKGMLASKSEYLVVDDGINGLMSGGLYEMPGRTLEEERVRREREQRGFEEKELWAILLGCAAGLGYFQRKSINYSAIRSNTIYFDPTPKLADPFLTQPTANYLLYQKSPQGIYLSPNQLRSLRQQDPTPIHNPYKSDVFAFGILLLQLTFLALQDDLYIKNKLMINEVLLAQRIEKLSKRFSPAMKSVVTMMLEPIENQRVDWNELEGIISKNQYRVYGGRGSVERERGSKGKEEGKFQLGDKIAKLTKFVGHSNYNSPREFTPRSKCDTPKDQTKNPSTQQTEKVASSAQITQQLVYSDKKGPTVVQIHGHKKQLSHAVMNFHKPPENIRSYSPAANHVTSRTGETKAIVQNPLPPFHGKPGTGRGITQSTYKKPDIIHTHSRKISQVKKQPKTICILPMVQSQVDNNCVSTPTPKPQYTCKTIPDQNLVQLTSRHSLSSLFSSNDDQMISQGYLKRIKKRSGNNRQQNRNNSQTTRQVITMNVMSNQYMDFSKTKKEPVFYSAKVIPAEAKRRPPEPGMEFVKETYKQGAIYEGWKLRGMRHGQGRFLYFDGGLYDGDWVMNRMQGQGTLVYPNGQKAYQGKWVQDHFQGFGKLYNQEPKYIEKFNYSNFDTVEPYWDTYQGNFESDLKHGFGVLVLANGQIFQGYFKNDYVHGEGLFRGKGGIVKGRWQKNKLSTIL